MRKSSKQRRPRPPVSRPARRTTPPGPPQLRALSKAALIARVIELQAGEPAMPAAKAAPPAHPVSLVIEASVRSGQTIEFPHGDVTVLGSVSSGAEIVAGGSIHVYGALRGRAIAGTAGDPKARIFCRSLEAELLSIDGRYRVAENFDPELLGRPVQAHLDGMKMVLLPLESGERSESGSAGLIRRRAAGLMHLMAGERTPRKVGALLR